MTTNNDITLRPAMTFAILKICHFILLSLAFLVLAWYSSPYFVFFSLAVLGFAWYRLLWIRSNRYHIGMETIQTSRGIFFKRTDELELYRIKDYIITRPLGLQLLGLMNVILKSTDSETPVLQFTGIPRTDLIETIRDRVQEARRHNNIYELN
ncbi:PH domain-containing protein [Mucilaginibacter sp. UR6-1]|uniref:PH domain-containing protein n=1 Tax=Mucilaginibacter sp. UR6-1 TaxID=1435643 RepID=UPI001E310F26|nr:PH domain-containing protein [Mucilaginibacter sp. UR6-1]MCC8407694.1 PH domain-containing protein [Mucilaginibacter sp. UR6-1]